MYYLSLSCRLLVWFFCFTWCQLVPEWLHSWESSFNELDYPGWLELVLARNQCWEHSWGCTGLRVNVPRDPGRNYRLLMTWPQKPDSIPLPPYSTGQASHRTSPDSSGGELDTTSPWEAWWRVCSHLYSTTWSIWTNKHWLPFHHLNHSFILSLNTGEMTWVTHDTYPGEVHLVEQFATVTNWSLPSTFITNFMWLHIRITWTLSKTTDTLWEQFILVTQELLEYCTAWHRSGLRWH